MNLPKFMSAVDSEIEKMSEQELKSCVRELARTLPEKERTHFLSIIANSNGIIKRGSDDESLKKEVEAERRNYYGECAAFIAAYGEVIESRGQKGAKQSLMLSYKTEYPRRRSFIQELKNYGFIG